MTGAILIHEKGALYGEASKAEQGESGDSFPALSFLAFRLRFRHL